MDYIKRNIDDLLLKWKDNPRRKPLLLRGARQVGKSWSVRNLGDSFEYYIEVNFEKRPDLKEIFDENRGVRDICSALSIVFDVPVVAGKTLLFLDEIQECESAIKSLWFFKEDYRELHVIAAGSLLEFTLKELPNFGVGRISTLMMYPFSFNEFLGALGKEGLRNAISNATPKKPLMDIIHNEVVRYYRTFLIVGGMPASVSAWVVTKDYTACAEEQRDIQLSYYLDFAKYAKKVDTQLLRRTLQSVVIQIGNKFVYSRVEGGYRSADVKKALGLLCDAGIVTEVSCSRGNGLPLGAEVKENFNKYIYLDTGLLLRILDLDLGGSQDIRSSILTESASNLVNKGSLAEMSVGLELIKKPNEGIPRELFYWENTDNGASSEIDYLLAYNLQVLPIEVKANTSGKMKSLRLFMEKKKIDYAVRCSLENFGSLSIDNNGTAQQIDIIPVYAINRF